MPATRYNRGMEYAEQLRNNLKRLRDEGVCSVATLATHAGVTQDAIFQFLRGDVKDLGSGKAMAIAKGLGIPIEELMCGSVKIPAKSA